MIAKKSSGKFKNLRRFMDEDEPQQVRGQQYWRQQQDAGFEVFSSKSKGMTNTTRSTNQRIIGVVPQYAVFRDGQGDIKFVTTQPVPRPALIWDVGGPVYVQGYPFEDEVIEDWSADSQFDLYGKGSNLGTTPFIAVVKVKPTDKPQIILVVQNQGQYYQWALHFAPRMGFVKFDPQTQIMGLPTVRWDWPQNFGSFDSWVEKQRYQGGGQELDLQDDAKSLKPTGQTDQQVSHYIEQGLIEQRDADRAKLINQFLQQLQQGGFRGWQIGVSVFTREFIAPYLSGDLPDYYWQPQTMAAATDLMNQIVSMYNDGTISDQSIPAASVLATIRRLANQFDKDVIDSAGGALPRYKVPFVKGNQDNRISGSLAWQTDRNRALAQLENWNKSHQGTVASIVMPTLLDRMQRNLATEKNRQDFFGKYTLAQLKSRDRPAGMPLSWNWNAKKEMWQYRPKSWQNWGLSGVTKIGRDPATYQNAATLLATRTTGQVIYDAIPKMVQSVVKADKVLGYGSFGPVKQNGVGLYGGRYIDPITARIRTIPAPTRKNLNPTDPVSAILYDQANLLYKWNAYVRAQQQLLNTFKRVKRGDFHRRAVKQIQNNVSTPINKVLARRWKSMITGFLSNGKIPYGLPPDEFSKIIARKLNPPQSAIAVQNAAATQFDSAVVKFKGKRSAKDLVSLGRLAQGSRMVEAVMGSKRKQIIAMTRPALDAKAYTMTGALNPVKPAIDSALMQVADLLDQPAANIMNNNKFLNSKMGKGNDRLGYDQTLGMLDSRIPILSDYAKSIYDPFDPTGYKQQRRNMATDIANRNDLMQVQQQKAVQSIRAKRNQERAELNEKIKQMRAAAVRLQRQQMQSAGVKVEQGKQQPKWQAPVKQTRRKKKISKG